MDAGQCFPKVTFKPPHITEPNELDPLDAELWEIQQFCLTSWSEHEVIERLEHAREMRRIEELRLTVADQKWG